MNRKSPTPRHIIIKMPNLKTAREKQEVTYKGALIKPAADYLTETLQARREWQEIFQLMKSKSLQPRVLSPARTSFKIEGKKAASLTKIIVIIIIKLKEHISTKPALQEMVKELL